jgi:hypothetical protein
VSWHHIRHIQKGWQVYRYDGSNLFSNEPARELWILVFKCILIQKEAQPRRSGLGIILLLLGLDITMVTGGTYRDEEGTQFDDSPNMSL